MDTLRNGHPADHPSSSDPESDEDTGNPMDPTDTLRHDLLTRLHSPHFTSKLKAQIRSTLALQLTPHHILTAQPAALPTDPLREVSHAVVAQHLKVSACDFALSVFLPESGLSQQHPMELGDLMGFLRVRGEVGAGGSFLSWLLQKLPVQAGKGGVGKEVQTEVDVERENVLEERLKMLEVRRRLGWEKGGRFDVAAAFQRYEADLEAGLRLGIRHDLTTAHAAELTRQLDEERSRHSRELLSVTANWEAKLREHTSAYESMHQRLHLAEQAQFTQRQELLQQLDTVAQRETKARQGEEEGRRRLAEKEEELVIKARQLAEVSQMLENKNAAIGQLVEGRVGEGLKVRGKGLDEREERVKKEEANLMKLKEHLTRTIVSSDSDDFPPSAPPLTEPKPFIQKIKTEFSRLHRENQKLKAKATEHSDYDALKTRLADAEKESTNLRRQLASLQNEMTQERQDHTQTVRELTDKMMQPERGMDALRREADGLREKMLVEGIRWEGERARLRGLIREKSREVEEWRGKVAEWKERFEQVNGRLGRMQGVASQATWMMLQPPSTNLHSSHISTPPAPTRFSAEPPAHDHAHDDTSSVSLRSVAEAKKRIRALEQEANLMQEHFHQYRRYVTDHWNPGNRSPRFSETTPAARTSGLILNPAALAQNTSYSFLERNGNAQRTSSVQYERIGYPSRSSVVERTPAVVENGASRKSLHLELREAEESRNRRNIEADVAELLEDTDGPGASREGSGW